MSHSPRIVGAWSSYSVQRVSGTSTPTACLGLVSPFSFALSENNMRAPVAYYPLLLLVFCHNHNSFENDSLSGATQSGQIVYSTLLLQNRTRSGAHGIYY
ncbi:uncharacterized protein BDV17DRAFT_265101 [Aspergillus undulatus]|uniref:uncharacterized protein n=1 Tax=Aspergillus undulatus TaxID=1810928 RepID=UPI003CCE3FB9